MFKTFDSAKLPTPWKEVGESVWSYAELMVNAAWFYAECQITDGIDTVTSIYMLSRSSQISDLINHPKITIRSIYLVSPPYLNGANCWSMGPLVKLSAGLISHEEYETNVEIYELANGSKYYSSSDIESEDGIANIKVVYS